MTNRQLQSFGQCQCMELRIMSLQCCSTRKSNATINIQQGLPFKKQLVVWKTIENKSRQKCPAHSAESPTLVGHGKGLPLPPPPLVQRHRLLPSLCRCPCPRPKLCQPLQQAKPLTSHHCHTKAPPDLAHDLAQQTRSSLVTLRSFQCCHSGLSKKLQKLV